MRISDLKRLFKKGVGILTEPLFLKPYFNPKIWGGRKLETEYGFNIPDGKIGELIAAASILWPTPFVLNSPPCPVILSTLTFSSLNRISLPILRTPTEAYK